MDALGSGQPCHLYGGGNGRIGEVGMAARRWIQPQSDRVYSILSCTRTARSARIQCMMQSIGVQGNESLKVKVSARMRWPPCRDGEGLHEMTNRDGEGPHEMTTRDGEGAA